MKTSKTNLQLRTGARACIVFFLLLLIPLPVFSDNTGTTLRFKPEYKIKRIPNEGVTIYNVNQDSGREEYFFTEFNADVILLIYRRISIDQIEASLAKKYYISKADSRRGVKRVINMLDEWGMVTE